MHKFPSFSELWRKLHYWLYEQPEKPLKIIQNQTLIVVLAIITYPTAWVIVWFWFGNLAQYTWTLFVVEAVVVPVLVIDWVWHRKERAEAQRVKR
jgi:hypothetical protein